MVRFFALLFVYCVSAPMAAMTWQKAQQWVVTHSKEERYECLLEYARQSILCKFYQISPKIDKTTGLFNAAFLHGQGISLVDALIAERARVKVLTEFIKNESDDCIKQALCTELSGILFRVPAAAD